MEKRKYKLGLTLSGGGARGIAHMGFIKALEEGDIKIEMISGSSAGAVVGALWAGGLSVEEMFELVRSTKIFQLLRPSFTRNGLLELTHLRKVLKEKLPYERLEDLPRPLLVTAVSLEVGRPEYFTEGILSEVVAASCAVPMLFKPVELQGRLYADGGLMKNLPVIPLKAYCEEVIAFDVLPRGLATPKSLRSSWKLLLRVVQLGIAASTHADVQAADYYIPCRELGSVSPLRLDRAEKIFQAGYEAGCRALKELPVSSQ